jgi:acetyl esterase/lipase
MDGELHPELSLARYLPSLPVSDTLVKVYRYLTPSPKMSSDTLTGTKCELVTMDIPDSTGSRSVPACIVRPLGDTASTPKRPAILWIHGGGMVLGSYTMDLSMMKVWAEELGAVIISVDYRLAPEHKAPAAVDDTFAAWQWMISNAADLGIDTSRLVVAGNSAGGGLAATTVQRIHDTESPIQPILQLLVYPMLDDRTVLRFNGSIKAHVWTPKANRYGWTSFLGCKPGSTDVPPYSVAARRQDLTGLPPMWIGVGTLDMFHDEDVAYARRLQDSGTDVELFVSAGAFHGFDGLFPNTSPAIAFQQAQIDALRTAFRI